MVLVHKWLIPGLALSPVNSCIQKYIRFAALLDLVSNGSLARVPISSDRLLITVDMAAMEFTIEDILQMHRGWITKLFINDRRSELEILELLYEQRLVVPLSQIHQCLLDWGLISPPLPGNSNTTSDLSSQISSDDWEIIPSQSSASIAREIFPMYTSTDMLDQYTTRPLPSLPATASTSDASKMQNRRNQKSLHVATDEKVRLSCKQDKDQNRLSLNTTAQSPSQLEAFLEDEQSHERLAVGLDRVPRLFIPRTDGSSRGRVRRVQVVRRHDRDHKKDMEKGDEEGKKM